MELWDSKKRCEQCYQDDSTERVVKTGVKVDGIGTFLVGARCLHKKARGYSNINMSGADYYEVDKLAIVKIIQRHEDELVPDGAVKIKGKEFHEQYSQDDETVKIIQTGIMIDGWSSYTRERKTRRNKRVAYRL
ncbi:hypothetical protein [Clostridium sp. BJN0013]